jgi:hypothetical protein
MSQKDKRSDHKFPAPGRHDEPTQEDFDEALRIYELDGQLENSCRIFPHEFSKQQRDAIVKLVPSNATESTTEEFLLYLGFAIGSYKHWEKNPLAHANFKKFYRELDKIRNYSDKLSNAITKLPPQFRERLDVGVCMGMLRDPHFAKLPGKPRYWSADWSNSFAFELTTLQSVADDVEKHFKKKNKGGGTTDAQMTLLAREVLTAYASCFNEIPPVTEAHPFTGILDIVTHIVGRYGAGVFSVMHYVGKVISEVRPESPREDSQSQPED